jgi:putative hemin transport protein
MQASYETLRQAFATARQQAHEQARPARHRDIAARLEVSEGELIAAHCGEFAAGESPLQARRLREEWSVLIESLAPLGELMALTRNESCVHEKVGVYANASTQHGVGLVLGSAIDLRVFYSQWAHGFAISEHLADGAVQRSLQFFDPAGQAVHKIFLRPATDVAAFESLIELFLSDEQQPGIEPGPAWSDAAEKPDAEINIAAFREAWASLRDTHEFFGMLKRFGVSRAQALRLADARYVQPLASASAQELLSRAAQEAVPIMCFVGNPGMIQIHSGPVKHVAVMGPWLNVLDPGFNLHLREDHIASAWLVRKPTSDGLVCSLELFDARQQLIAQFFGERKPGQAERCDWRELLESLTDTAPTELAC